MKRPASRPCVFKEAFVREQIDPRVKEIWEAATHEPAPFGRLRQAFQREHCAKINPYTGGQCPYRPEECAMAFLSGVQNSTLPWIENPQAYFVKLVASTGIDRADNKPLAREFHRDQAGSSDAGDGGTGHAAGRPSDLGSPRAKPPTRVVPAVLDDEDRLHRARRRPEALGDLLGALDLGPRPRRDGDRESEGGQ